MLSLRALVGVSAVVLGTVLGLPGSVSGQGGGHDPSDQESAKHAESTDEQSHTMRGPHDGLVIMTPERHFEVLFLEQEVRLYAYDGAQEPICSMDDVSGSVSLQTKRGRAAALVLNYVPPDAEKRTQGYLAAPYDFGGIEKGTKALIQVDGLGRKSVEFESPVELAEAVSYVCPMNCVDPAQDPMSCPKCGMKMVRANKGDEEHGQQNKRVHAGHGH